MIEVLNFHKSFGNKKIHHGVTFKVHKGHCLGLIGGSGVGKSVILRSLIGLEKPDSGQILIDQEDIVPLPERELYRIRKKVAYAFQNGALFDSMSVFENLAYPLREHTLLSESEIEERVLAKLEIFDLKSSAFVYPGHLSGGMQKRVGVARAMILNPEVILYDEPTAGLDPFNTRRIQELILKLKSTGVTSILVTHDMPTAFAVCDEMAILKDGKIAVQGRVEEFKKSHNPIVSQFINGDSSSWNSV